MELGSHLVFGFLLLVLVFDIFHFIVKKQIISESFRKLFCPHDSIEKGVAGEAVAWVPAGLRGLSPRCLPSLHPPRPL